jgi:hypothetical protein
MGKKVAELEEDRAAGKAGAQERLKLFRAERILLVDSIIQVGYRQTSTSCCNNLSYRAAPKFNNGHRRKHMHSYVFPRKGGSKGAKREY